MADEKAEAKISLHNPFLCFLRTFIYNASDRFYLINRLGFFL